MSMEFEDLPSEPVDEKKNSGADAPPGDADGQTQLFDTSGKKYNLHWIDEKAALFIPKDTLHWRAWKLQMFILRLEKLAETNPGQLKTATYLEALNDFSNLVEQINNREDEKSGGTVDAGEVVEGGDAGATHEVGERIPLGVDSGVSADNPFAG